jgi:hypothetical protein
VSSLRPSVLLARSPLGERARAAAGFDLVVVVANERPEPKCSNGGYERKSQSHTTFLKGCFYNNCHYVHEEVIAPLAGCTF